MTRRIVDYDFAAERADRIYADIGAERIRQDDKFGRVRDMELTEWVCVLTEEVGEVAKAVHEAAQQRISWEGGRTATRAELVQVAAVAVNIIEHMDRGDC